MSATPPDVGVKVELEFEVVTREAIRLELLRYVDELSARNAEEAAAVERAVAKIFGSIER